MHIPDGFLSLPTALGTAAMSVIALKQSVKLVRKKLGSRQVPIMGVMAAFVFAAQMLNFPIIGGTSGHLIGAVLLAILLGPMVASLIMTSILIIQALIFVDGGILALGANIFNMAVVAPFFGYMIYQSLVRVVPGKNNKAIAVFGAAWSSVVLATVACTLELVMSGLPFMPVVTAMLYWHIIIGIGEGVITTAIILYVWNTRKEWVDEIVRV
jgi:cobalt/nickel transport system permease protein